jgi:hypothetical protein
MRQVLIRCGLAAVEPFVDAVNAPSLQKSVGRGPADRRQLYKTNIGIKSLEEVRHGAELV